MSTILELDQITKSYLTDEVETLAINELSLQIEQGEFIAIMGPSGCGKSTLLNVIGLLDSPDGGSFRLLGEEVARYREFKRSKLRKQYIGFIFQNFNLIDELSVFKNIELPLLYLNYSASERRQRVKAVLEQVNMENRMKHYPKQLSGGQQQRVAIARAMVTEPKLLLADEPTGNLDSKNGEEVMQLIQALNQNGSTVVMVTHSERDATYANRVIHLMDGKIEHEASTTV